MVTVQFTPFSSTVSPAFWHALVKLKLDVLKLDQDAIPVVASYAAGRTIKDRETGADVAIPSTVTLGDDAFQASSSVRAPPGSTLATGKFKNFNTIEDFKSVDKQALFNELADEMWSSITAPDTDPSVALTQFLLITFADLKKYKFYYWFAFPAFVAKPSWEISENGWVAAAETFTPAALESTLQSLATQGHDHALPPFFLARRSSGDVVETAPLAQYRSFFANVPESERIIGFLDPSSQAQNPGWPLRNLLAYLAHLEHPSSPSSAPITFNVLCWRDTEVPRAGQDWRSRFGTVTQAAVTEQAAARPTALGWERNAAGKLAPRLADLAPMMDPVHLAEQAIDLNLKLMRWRILPALNLETVAETKCLLLGAGTLGCFVARALLAWGVRKITLVDSGKVSFSNPVRQPLFEFEDCLDGGKPKAEAAAASLRRIFPGVDATGHTLAIPMPGHPIPSAPALIDQARIDVQRLEKLIDEHDVVFLLMDSRESRWLPTMLGKAKDKIVINAALGFDSFLVMRHGSRSADPSNPKLGCYYCNDVVAPADSTTDRTLDQMCTVTRPGLASIASSNAVEILVSLLQHPLRNLAPSPPNPGTQRHNTEDGSIPPTESILGLVPHQLRGTLAHFNNVLITGASYERCTGCSEIVINEYEQRGFDMLLEAFNDNDYLERLTGLDKLKAETEAMLEGVEWAGAEGADSGEDDF